MQPARGSVVVRAVTVALLAGLLEWGAGCSSGSSTPAPPVTVAVTGGGQLRAGGTAQFSVSVGNTSNTAVTWEVNGVAGGSAAAGTISTSGLYTAPLALPSPNTVTIAAISQADSTISGSAVETLLNPVPVLTTATATQTGVSGGVLLDLRGSSFVNGAQVVVGSATVAAQLISSGELQATFTPAAGVTSVQVEASNPDPGSAVSSAVTATIPQIAVSVTGAADTRLGASTQFTATVTNSPNTAVNWQVNGTTGGSAAVGTISTTGLYTAPAALPSGNSVTITAISQAQTAATGTEQEAIWNPVPAIATASATPTGTSGAVLLDLLGTGFVSGAQIFVGSTAQTTQYVSATELQATYTPAANTSSVTASVTNPNPGTATSNAATVTIPQIAVTVTGAAQTRLGLTTQFAAAVTNTSNTAVTWQVNGVTGGAASTGTISATGLYTAPASIPAVNPITIAAVSQAFASATGTLQETVWNPVPTVASGTATPSGNTGALLLDVHGTNFVAGAQVAIGSSTQTATVVSSTELQASFFPIASATSVIVSVTNPNPGSASSSALSVQLPLIAVSVGGAAQTVLGLTTQFIATVTGSSETLVNWQVNGVTGGSAATGTISTTGLYTAPIALPSPNTVTIDAVSVASSAAVGSLQETILNPVPAVSSVVPTLTNTAGSVLLNVVGTSFAGGAQIQVGGSILTTTLVSATQAQANYVPATGATSITITVINPNDGSVASNAVTVALPTIYAYTGPVPADETLSPYFTTAVGGVALHAYWSQVHSVNFYQYKSALTGQYYYPDAPYNASYGIATFASVQLKGSADVSIGFVSGFPTTGAITSSSQVKILPTGAIDPTTITVVDNTIQFAVNAVGVAQQLTIEVDGDYLNSLHLFINPMEVAPTGGSIIPAGFITQGTINAFTSPFIFPPGEYWVNGNLDFRQNTEIYLEDGAIVKWYTPIYPQLNTGPMITLGGNPAAPNVNMYMHGSGIIDGQAAQQYAANGGNGCGYGTELLNVNNLTLTATNTAGVDGVILRNSCVFNMPVGGVLGIPQHHFVINNVKILGFEGNTDGIDLFTDQYVDITHSFFRTADDQIVVYQLNSPQTYPTANITATNNIFWNELAHAMAVGGGYNASQASDPVAVDTVLFDHNTVIHDTGKAFLMGIFGSNQGILKNITFSNNTVEETRATIGVYLNPGYGATNNPQIVGPLNFTNINVTSAQQVQTVNTYVVPVPNIQMLIQLPYGNPYVGDGTTTSASPASIQGPVQFNNVVMDGLPVTQDYLSPGYYDTNNNPVAQNLITEGVQLRNATYGTFIFESSQIAGDILPVYCNGSVCPLLP